MELHPICSTCGKITEIEDKEWRDADDHTRSMVEGTCKECGKVLSRQWQEVGVK